MSEFWDEYVKTVFFCRFLSSLFVDEVGGERCKIFVFRLLHNKLLASIDGKEEEKKEEKNTR